MKKKFIVLCAVLMAIVMLATACAPTATQVATQAPAEATAPENTPVPPAGTTEPTAAPTEPPSLVGGTVIMAFPFEPDSLDIQKANTAAYVCAFVHSSLVAKDTEGNFVPYMAESWDLSEDGLTYTFHLKQGPKFQNGDPVTAQDWVWSFQRAVDPETVSPLTGPVVAKFESFEAVDDYTLKIVLKEPYYYLLDNLQYEGIMGVLSQRAVAEYGDDYARNPLGAGPFIFKEWVTGDHITLERNPDFTWGPSYTNGNPPNIQTLIFRIIPESSTIVAGLEAGEIQWAGNGYLPPVDVNNLESTGEFDVLRFPAMALMPYVNLNLSKPPFDDIRVRQALNMAVNLQAIIDIVVPDSGATPGYGPLPPSAEGY
jgi:peptide/nickel transport system substrate-binding protein